MKTLCFGSLNLDHVYRVPHILREGETLDSISYALHAGGKGLNQAIALSRAGAQVWMAGHIGQDGGMLREVLRENGVDTSLLFTSALPTGHTIIQVNDQGENCILLHGGANQSVTPDMIAEVFAAFGPGDLLVLQNETNVLAELLHAGYQRGMRIALNPSPISARLHTTPLDVVDLLILNEIEGAELGGGETPEEILDGLLARYPLQKIVLTLGGQGAIYADAGTQVRVPAFPVQAVDSTGAGDTFTGFFLRAWTDGQAPQEALAWAAKAAALAVSRPGAAASIPTAAEVAAFGG